MQTRNRNKSNQIVIAEVAAKQAAPAAATAGSVSDGLSETHGLGQLTFSSTRAPLLLYWVFCLAVGLLVLHDAIFSWHIPTVWTAQPFFLGLAIVVTVASQIAYWLVARAGGRSLRPLSACLFVLFNGPIECFMFLAMYQLLFNGAKLIFGNLNVVNVGFGILGFVIYSGLAHGIYWARLLPRHFTAEARWQPLRRIMTPIQAAIVVVWCLYFYKTGDIWTLVLLHALMDAVLMIRVRPPVLASRLKD